MKRQKLYLSTVDEKAHILAQEYGLGLEIAEFSTAWNLDRDLEQTEALVKPKLRYSDRFTLHGPFSELFPSAVDPLARKLASYRFCQTIHQAQQYDINRLIFHGGYNPWLFFPCWYQPESVKFWKDFLPHIPKNMVLYIENVMEDEPDLLADIVRQIDSPQIKMCLDIGHANSYSKKSPLQWLESCSDVIGHFHVHNNDGSWDTHSALFEGTIPMEEFLYAADSLCPSATITLELPQAESSVRWLIEKKFLEV